MRIAILHGYSGLNKGDRLLVDETLALLREAFDEPLEITLFASRPETFAVDVEMVRTRPTSRGFHLKYLRTLLNLGAFDLVVGVGGGYLRFGTFREAIATSLVHGPQLLAAGALGRRTIYLPQSVGPAPQWLSRRLENVFSKIDHFFVRDDTSMREFPNAGFERLPDIALLSGQKAERGAAELAEMPVLSVRALAGRLPATFIALSEEIGRFDGYVQSSGGTNDDAEAVAALKPVRVLSERELLEEPGPKRVVVAVRLHAALMALAVGHYVIHLAYERKGYGAFSDLGLQDYVHDSRNFSPYAVSAQVTGLLTNEQEREVYDRIVRVAYRRFLADRQSLVAMLQGLNDKPVRSR